MNAVFCCNVEEKIYTSREVVNPTSAPLGGLEVPSLPRSIFLICVLQ
jgi:hypothetical protein